MAADYRDRSSFPAGVPPHDSCPRTNLDAAERTIHLSDFVLDNKGRHKWPVVYYSLLHILRVKVAGGGAESCGIGRRKRNEMRR